VLRPADAAKPGEDHQEDEEGRSVRKEQDLVRARVTGAHDERAGDATQTDTEVEQREAQAEVARPGIAVDKLRDECGARGPEPGGTEPEQGHCDGS
jgi:hypothetical protein